MYKYLELLGGFFYPRRSLILEGFAFYIVVSCNGRLAWRITNYLKIQDCRGVGRQTFEQKQEWPSGCQELSET